MLFMLLLSYLEEDQITWRNKQNSLKFLLVDHNLVYLIGSRMVNTILSIMVRYVWYLWCEAMFWLLSTRFSEVYHISCKALCGTVSVTEAPLGEIHESLCSHYGWYNYPGVLWDGRPIGAFDLICWDRCSQCTFVKCTKTWRPVRRNLATPVLHLSTVQVRIRSMSARLAPGFLCFIM